MDELNDGLEDVEELPVAEKLDIDSDEHMDVQLAFLKLLPSFPPIGKHKHFRAIALQRNVQEVTRKDVGMSLIWQTLEDLYDVDELGQLHEAEQEELPQSPRELSPLPRTPPPDSDTDSLASESGDQQPDRSRQEEEHASDDSLSPPPPSRRQAKHVSSSDKMGTLSPAANAESTPRGRQTRGGGANRRGRTRSASSAGSKSHNAARRARQLSVRPSSSAASSGNSLMSKYPDYPYFSVYPHHPAFRSILALELDPHEGDVSDEEDDTMTVVPESMIKYPLVYAVVQAEQEQEEEEEGDAASHVGFQSRSAAIIDSAHFELEFALPLLPMPGATSEDQREVREWMRLIENRGLRRLDTQKQPDKVVKEGTSANPQDGIVTAEKKNRRMSFSQSVGKAAEDGEAHSPALQASTPRQIKRSIPLSTGQTSNASGRQHPPVAGTVTEEVADDDEDELALHPNEHFAEPTEEEQKAMMARAQEADRVHGENAAQQARGRSPTTSAKKSSGRKAGSGSRGRGRGQSRSTSSSRPAKRERAQPHDEEATEEGGGRTKRARRR